MPLKLFKGLCTGLLILLMISTVLITGCQSKKQMYIGRTTLIENKALFGPSVYKPSAQLTERRINTLVSIATSDRVMMNSANILRDLGLVSSPQKLLSSVTIEPVQNTNILTIEVQLPDPQEAKLAADVIASEFKRSLAEIRLSELKQRHRQLKEQLLRAEHDMAIAYTDLSNASNKQGPAKNAVEMAKMEADVKATTTVYSSFKIEYNKLGAEIKMAKNQPVMITIDPAHIIVVK